MIEVNVLGSTREDFVANNDDAGSDGLIHGSAKAIKTVMLADGQFALASILNPAWFGSKSFATLAIVFAVEAGINHGAYGFTSSVRLPRSQALIAALAAFTVSGAFSAIVLA